MTDLVRWSSPRPEATVARLAAALGGDSQRVGGSLRVRLANAVVEVVPGRRLEDGRLAGGRAADERLLTPAGLFDGARPGNRESHEPGEAGRLGLDAAGPGSAWRLVALGWATVDLDRTAGEFGLRVEPGPSDRLLGARCGMVVGPGVVLLEPATEGRLAASLARWGEGPIALYVARGQTGVGPDIDGWREALRALELPTSAVARGPFGRSFLLAGGPPWGPHLVFCERRRGTAAVKDASGEG